MNEPLRATNIGRRVGSDRWLWRGLDFTIEPGEAVGIVGPSGSGKSTLLRALAALDPLDEGDVTLGDGSLSSIGASAWRTRIVYLHQQPALGNRGTVEAVLRRPFSLMAWADREFNESTIRERITGLGRDADRMLATQTSVLSGGEAQIVALLRALQFDPPMLLLDEPTASLDATATAAVEQLIREWAEADATRSSLRVSHDTTALEAVTTRTIELAGGSS